MKRTYEDPIFTRHEKLVDITGQFGSGKGKDSKERGEKGSTKEGKEKEGKESLDFVALPPQRIAT